MYLLLKIVGQSLTISMVMISRWQNFGNPTRHTRRESSLRLPASLLLVVNEVHVIHDMTRHDESSDIVIRSPRRHLRRLTRAQLFPIFTHSQTTQAPVRRRPTVSPFSCTAQWNEFQSSIATNSGRLVRVINFNPANSGVAC